jgi:hypothetical protein
MFFDRIFSPIKSNDRIKTKNNILWELFINLGH